jgi:SPP1 gp7 family putative phage head morphogenesis protein
MDTYDYWIARAQRSAAQAYNSQEKRTATYLKAYRGAYADLEKETAALYAKLSRNGKLSLTELYKYNRYKVYLREVKGICSHLARGEIKFMDSSFAGLYEEVYRATGKIGGIDFTKVPKKTLAKVLEHPWSGENYSSRVWANRDLLVRHASQTVVRGAVKGQSITDMSRELRGHVESSAYNARRLIRTESMHFINQGQIDGYKRLGIKEVNILIAEDERLCDECRENAAGNPYPVEEAQLLLPTHPNCRCTYAPTRAAIDSALESLLA